MAMNARSAGIGHHDSGTMLPLVFLMACAMLLGMAVGLGIPIIQLGVVSLFAMAVLAFTPRLLFWVVLAGTLVAAGLIRLYLPQLQAFRWLLASGAIALPFLLAAHALYARQFGTTRTTPPFAFWALAFFAYTVFAAFALSNGPANAILGLKDYFQVWGLLLAFMLISHKKGFQKTLLLFILAVGAIQVPFALHQFFFLAPLRAGIAGIQPADIVAGTFGSDMLGGGNNAALAAYQFFCIAIVLGLWKVGQMGAGRMLALAGYLAIPVFLNETKISFVFAVLVFVVMFGEEIKRNPLRFVQGGIFFATLLTLFVAFYVFVAEKSDRIHGLGEYLDLLTEHNLYRGYGTYQLNRITALGFWFSEHVPRDLLHAFVGHGLTQTREASAFVDIGTTLAAKRYAGMGIGVTALSGLLWEVGLIGAGLIIALFISAFRLAGSLAHDCAAEPHREAFLKGVQAGIAVVGLSLLHKSLFMFEMTYQAIIILLLGYLAYEYRQLRAVDISRPTRGA